MKMEQVVLRLVFVIVVLIVIICEIITIYEIFQDRLDKRLNEIEDWIRTFR